MQDIVKSHRLVIYRVEAPIDRRLTRSGQGFEKFIQLTAAYERAMIGKSAIAVEATF